MLFTFLTVVTLWSRFTSNFYAMIGQNLTGEFMGKIYAASCDLFRDGPLKNLWGRAKYKKNIRAREN